MKNKPYFKCTVMLIKPNEAGMERIKNEMLEGISPEKPTDENGQDAEWYRNLGLPVPEELNSSPKSTILSVDLELDDDEVDITYKDAVIDISEFAFIEQNEKFGCTLYTKNGYELIVKETIEEIIERVYG